MMSPSLPPLLKRVATAGRDTWRRQTCRGAHRLSHVTKLAPLPPISSPRFSPFSRQDERHWGGESEIVMSELPACLDPNQASS